MNRFKGERGECGLGAEVLVSSVGPHFGEEPELVGYRGSGTIFFAGCNLDCRFCQNWDISHGQQGHRTSIEKLTEYMLDLEKMGCHNVNFVSPTPFTPSILEALHNAREQGLGIPVVYNSGGYESLDVLQMCAGLVEIYMPDAKYSEAQIAGEFSGTPDYPEVNRAALREMQRQAGDLWEVGGIAKGGLLIRHLVLPNYPVNTRGVLEFIATEISANAYVNIMDQYRPCYKAELLPGMDRRLTLQEYEDAVEMAINAGLSRGFA
ncbi:radical SAM protein [bacterium]|nr:radical SAM protein [bacterium]